MEYCGDCECFKAKESQATDPPTTFHVELAPDFQDLQIARKRWAAQASRQRGKLVRPDVHLSCV